VDTSGGLRLKVPMAEHNGPQRLIGVEDNHLRDAVLGDLVDGLGLDLRIGVLALVRILGNDDVAHALLGEDF